MNFKSYLHLSSHHNSLHPQNFQTYLEIWFKNSLPFMENCTEFLHKTPTCSFNIKSWLEAKDDHPSSSWNLALSYKIWIACNKIDSTFSSFHAILKLDNLNLSQPAVLETCVKILTHYNLKHLHFQISVQFHLHLYLPKPNKIYF